jgi:hypothetical protein
MLSVHPRILRAKLAHLLGGHAIWRNRAFQHETTRRFVPFLPAESWDLQIDDGRNEILSGFSRLCIVDSYA